MLEGPGQDAQRNLHSGYLALSYGPFGLLVPLRVFLGGGGAVISVLRAVVS